MMRIESRDVEVIGVRLRFSVSFAEIVPDVVWKIAV